jgi:hypothetical protein
MIPEIPAFTDIAVRKNNAPFHKGLFIVWLKSGPPQIFAFNIREMQTIQSYFQDRSGEVIPNPVVKDLFYSPEKRRQALSV